jgi:staphylococcal nuclease domain-containing protein 1
VAEINSGDSLTVERSSDKKLIRVFLSCCKAPAYRKDKPESWAHESREALRKLSIGKDVRVEPEYKVVIPSKEGKDEMILDFASVILLKNNKNVCLEPLEKGLLKTNLGRDDENAGPYVEDLLAAEQKAIKAKKGIHSPKEQPAP